MILNDDNFFLWAAHHYDLKKSSSHEEFNQDLKKIVFLKKLFVRYEKNNDLQIRLILNHIIILYNCFEVAATPMLFLKLEDYHHYLKPVLMFLGRLPKTVEYDNKIINTDDIPMDANIINELRKI